MGWPKGKKQPRELVERRLRWQKGFSHSEETKRKISKAFKGRKLSAEHKENIRVGVLRYWAGLGSAWHRRKVADLLRSRKGPLNPLWKEDRSLVEYPPEFNAELRRRIRERDNYTCQKCGRLEAEEKVEFGRVLGIHHIDYIKKNSEENNLITLCGRCNTEVNFDRPIWRSVFKGVANSKNPEE